MSGLKGDEKVASSSKSNRDLIPEVLSLQAEVFYHQAEVISHRERRRRLFAKGSADWISHGDCRSKGRETDGDEDKWEVEKRRIESIKEAQMKADLEVTEVDESSWLSYSEFRNHWNHLWSGCYGSFEDTTRIPSMQFTDKPAPSCAFALDTLQVFSVKLAATRGRLQLPFDVFGMIAARDPVDNNRNIIFQRTRDDCQTLTIKDPYLVLTGPTRAVMARGSGTVVIEVDLKVKGSTEWEDECLSLIVIPFQCFTTMYSDLFKYACTSKLSTLELTIGHIIWSVEATISVRVIHGSWPDGLRGVFAAFTTGTYDGQDFVLRRVIGIGHERIVLLDSRAEKLPITGDGKIKLSRRVVSVETSGKMMLRVKALEGDKQVVEKEASFDPLGAGSSISELEFSFCKMEVTVCWSVISYVSVL